MRAVFIIVVALLLGQGFSYLAAGAEGATDWSSVLLFGVMWFPALFVLAGAKS